MRIDFCGIPATRISSEHIHAPCAPKFGITEIFMFPLFTNPFRIWAGSRTLSMRTILTALTAWTLTTLTALYRSSTMSAPTASLVLAASAGTGSASLHLRRGLQASLTCGLGTGCAIHTGCEDIFLGASDSGGHAKEVKRDRLRSRDGVVVSV